MLTHSAGAFPGLSDALRSAGTAVRHAPLIRFAPPADQSRLDRALARLADFRAIALTSPRAATVLRRRLDREPIGAPLPPVWVVGPGTEAALGAPVAGTGDGTAASLAERLIRSGMTGPVLFLCGERRLDLVPTLLRGAGIRVDEVVAYRTLVAAREAVRAACVDASAIVVASPSVAELLATALPIILHRPPTIALGPTTAVALAKLGFTVGAIADMPTEAGLVRAVLKTVKPGGGRELAMVGESGT
ncbi:MAG: uroporphyrinogen-III synthase [Gemmatimonadota bacterium]